MSPELEQKLIKKYPVIFRDAGKSEMESCMAFGCECNDGWYDILDSMCEALTYTYTTGIYVNGESVVLDAPQVVAEQIKEKFGTLRFYYRLEYPQAYLDLLKKYEGTDSQRTIENWADDYRNYFSGIVHYAEVLTARTCEMTGRPGKMHKSGSGWYKVLNEEYAKTDEGLKARNFQPIKQNESQT